MKSFIKLDLPQNLHKSKTLEDEGIDVFAPKYRQGSERYLLQGLERWHKDNPNIHDLFFDDDHWDHGCSIEDTF